MPSSSSRRAAARTAEANSSKGRISSRTSTSVTYSLAGGFVPVSLRPGTEAVSFDHASLLSVSPCPYIAFSFTARCWWYAVRQLSSSANARGVRGVEKDGQAVEGAVDAAAQPTYIGPVNVYADRLASAGV